MNLDLARDHMIHQQICPWAVLEPDLMEVLALVKREDFVPSACRRLAYADTELPLGHGATMLSPKIEAQALRALGIRKHEKILEIGSGSGYMAALLAAHADHVWSVEIDPALADTARANLHRTGVYNATVETGDGACGWPFHAPYDVIMVSGSLAELPPELPAQLKVGGRLFAVVGREPAMTALLVTRTAADAFTTRGLFETRVEPLRHGPALSGFAF